jgi:hypothetical protein
MNKWIKRISYNDGGRVADGFKPMATGDCVVRSLSILTGFGYGVTRNKLNEFIKRERGTDRSHVEQGVYPRTYRKFLKTVGVTKFKSISSWSQLPTSGRAMVVLEEHVVAYVDGIINDTFDPVSDTHCGSLIGYYEF